MYARVRMVTENKQFHKRGVNTMRISLWAKAIVDIFGYSTWRSLYIFMYMHCFSLILLFLSIYKCMHLYICIYVCISEHFYKYIGLFICMCISKDICLSAKICIYTYIRMENKYKTIRPHTHAPTRRKLFIKT